MTGGAPRWDLGRLRKSAEALARTVSVPSGRVGRYALVRELASGAMGVVFEAEDTQLKRKVALKILRDIHGASDVIRHRFHREALAAASISHPNVLRVYDAGEAEGKMYLAMELMTGRSLKEAMAQEGAPLRASLELLVKVARGVAAAHEKGIVHRDVKPANILVDAAGEPKVGDFGLAHLADSNTELTRSGTPIGTPMYMAPEQVRGDLERIGPATDVYALGAILYEMLTGRTPHQGDNTAEVYGRILSQDPVPPRRLRSKIDAELETICLKSLEGEPERRYATAKEFADDLRRHLDGESILARPAGPVDRGLKWLRRRRALAVGGLLTMLFLPALCILGASLLERSRRDRARAAATQILETARPALEKAAQGLYRSSANLEELRRKVGQARPLIDEAIRLEPASPVAHHLLGRAWELEGREELAEAAWRRALELVPGFGPARYHLGRLLAIRSFMLTIGYSDPDRVHRRPVADALAMEAAALLEGAGLDDPIQREVCAVLRLYLARDAWKAREACLEAVAKHGRADGVEDFHWLQGWVTRGPEQMKAYDLAIELRPHHVEALFCRGQAHGNAGLFREAEADYTRTLAVNPRFTGAWINRGNVRLDLENFKGSVEDCGEALRLDPRSVPALITRAIAKRRLGDIDGAIADYTAAIAVDAGLVTPWINRGNARGEKGDLEGALKDYDKAVELAPDNARIRLSRAESRWLTREAGGARADVDRSIELDPAAPEGWHFRGVMRQELGDLAGSAQDLRKALERAPEGHPHRAAIIDLLGRLEPRQEH